MHEDISSPFIHEGLTNDETYCFRMTYVQDDVESDESDEICIAPGPVADSSGGDSGDSSGIGGIDLSPLVGDSDDDGIINLLDNCVTVSNADQADADSDGQGDVCDPDADGDGVADSLVDSLAEYLALDTDGDSVKDFLDNCPTVSNADQADADSDDKGDACDPDADGDGVWDGIDLGLIDVSDFGVIVDLGVADSDGDGVSDLVDNCINNANADQADTDGDGIGNACDAFSIIIPEIDWGIILPLGL